MTGKGKESGDDSNERPEGKSKGSAKDAQESLTGSGGTIERSRPKKGGDDTGPGMRDD